MSKEVADHTLTLGHRGAKILRRQNRLKLGRNISHGTTATRVTSRSFFLSWPSYDLLR